jgi:hypothetical protein
MPEQLTIQQMREQYPDQWLLLASVETDAELNVLRGEVLAHSPSRDDIYGQLLVTKGERLAIEYTGDIPEDLAVML